jgi:hypothetical protein
MILIISAVMALIPLLGIAWIFTHGPLLTVDGLFMTLILLGISGAFAGNVALELRRRKLHAATARAGTSGLGVTQRSSTSLRHEGRVERVEFFEAHVGQANMSIVTLRDGAGASRTLVLDGDVRNALPAGRRVELEFRKDNGRNVLVNVSYA